MKGIKYVVFLIPVVAFAFFLIYSSRPDGNVKYEPTVLLGEKEWIIASSYIDCNEKQCLQVKENEADEFMTLEQEIEGFEYSEGVEYRVRVNENSEGNLTLDAILSIMNPEESRLANSESYPIETVTEVTELRTEVLTEGYGEVMVEPNATVVANYSGWIASTGDIFDSSFNSGSNDGIQFSLLGVIEGWQQGVPGMKLGEVRRIYVPSELGYGEAGSGSIPPNSDLIFDVELMAIN